MKLEDLIHTFNTYITELRIENNILKDGYFVVLKYTNYPSTFSKAIKLFNIDLIYIYDKGKNKRTILTESITDKCTSDPQELKLLSTLLLAIIKYIMKLIYDSKLFNKILNNDF